MISKKAIKYCMERNYFRDGVFEVDGETSYNCHSLMTQIFSDLKLQFNSTEELVEFIHNQQIIILLTSCSKLIQNHSDEFGTLLKKLIDQTEHLRIIIVYEQQNLKISGHSLTNKVHVQPLRKQMACKFLRSYDKNGEIFGETENDQLLDNKIFEHQLSNSQLLDIFNLLKSNKSWNDITSIFQKQKNDSEDPSDYKQHI